MKNKELVQDKKYTLGKRAFWFLFFKHGFKPFLFLLFCLVLVYFINTVNFQDWFLTLDTIITINILNLWIISLGACVLFLIFVSTFERYIQHKFLLGEHSFHVRRGIFMVKEKVIPYRHIQNVDIDRPYHYRLLGLSKLNITTSRLDNFEDEKTNLIPIIDKHLAKKLSDFLIKQGVRSHNGPRSEVVQSSNTAIIIEEEINQE
ncbi:PH domain-containing protein [Arenimonas sp.]|nr:PH domain-containing protein [Candidatus Parcubacteria bacterium]